MANLYPTANTVAIYLNGHHVDQAYRVDYRDSAPKVPIYGYNDYTYSKAARAQGLVQGLLVTNFTYAGYLAGAIRNAKEGALSDPLVKVQEHLNSELRSEIPPNTTEESRKARAEYLATLIKESSSSATALSRVGQARRAMSRHATKRTITDFFNQIKISTATPSLVERNPLMIDGAGADTLDVYYQDPESSLWYVRFENVHFTEISQQISQAGAEGSSEPLYEIAQFISSRRTVKHII